MLMKMRKSKLIYAKTKEGTKLKVVALARLELATSTMSRWHSTTEL